MAISYRGGDLSKSLNKTFSNFSTRGVDYKNANGSSMNGNFHFLSGADQPVEMVAFGVYNFDSAEVEELYNYWCETYPDMGLTDDELERLSNCDTTESACKIFDSVYARGWDQGKILAGEEPQDRNYHEIFGFSYDEIARFLKGESFVDIFNSNYKLHMMFYLDYLKKMTVLDDQGNEHSIYFFPEEEKLIYSAGSWDDGFELINKILNDEIKVEGKDGETYHSYKIMIKENLANTGYNNVSEYKMYLERELAILQAISGGLQNEGQHYGFGSMLEALSTSCISRWIEEGAFKDEFLNMLKYRCFGYVVETSDGFEWIDLVEWDSTYWGPEDYSLREVSIYDVYANHPYFQEILNKIDSGAIKNWEDVSNYCNSVDEYGRTTKNVLDAYDDEYGFLLYRNNVGMQINELKNSLDFANYLKDEMDYTFYKYEIMEKMPDFEEKCIFTDETLTGIYDVLSKYTSYRFCDQEAMMNILCLYINGDSSVIYENSTLYYQKTQNGSSYNYEVTSSDSMLKNYLKWAPLMSEEDKKCFNYLWNTEGYQKAYEYLNKISGHMDRVYVQNEMKKDEEWAKENEFLASLASVFVTPFEGIGAFFYSMDCLIKGDKIRSTFTYSSGTYYRTVVAIEIAQYSEELSFLYSTGMSMADTGLLILANAATGGTCTVLLSATLMGSRSYVATLNSALDRGLSDSSAVMLAFASASVESLCESYSVGHLMDLEGKSADWIQKTLLKTSNINSAVLRNTAKFSLNVFGTMLSQGIAEGEEEFCTEILNFFADQIISGDLSEFNLSMASKVNEGKNESDAFLESINEFKNQCFNAFLGGFVSGCFFGLGAQGISSVKSNIDYSKNIKSITEGIISEYNIPSYNLDMKNLRKDIKNDLKYGKYENIITRIMSEQNTDIMQRRMAATVTVSAIENQLGLTNEQKSNLLTVIDNMTLKMKDIEAEQNKLGLNISVENIQTELNQLNYAKSSIPKYIANYLASNVRKFLYKDTSSFEGLNEQIMKNGLYHFTGAADAILSSGYIKASDMNTSYGNPKTFFFNGVPDIGAFATNLDSIPIKTTAVKVTPTTDLVNDSKLKLRYIDDMAITYDGKFNLDGYNTEKCYFALVVENGKLSYKQVSEDIYNNYENTNMAKVLSNYVSNKGNATAIKGDFLTEIANRNKNSGEDISILENVVFDQGSAKGLDESVGFDKSLLDLSGEVVSEAKTKIEYSSDIDSILNNFLGVDTLTEEGKKQFFAQVERYKSLSKLPSEIHIPNLNADGKVVFEEGTLIHGIGRYNAEVVESISKVGILSGQAFGVDEDGETFYCADFFRVSDNLSVEDYRAIRMAADVGNSDRFTPLSGPWGEKYMAFIVSPNDNNSELLSYDCYRDGTDASDITKSFVNLAGLPFDAADRSSASSILFGVPSNSITGIVVGQKILQNTEAIDDLKKKFPNCYITDNNGNLVYNPLDNIGGKNVQEVSRLAEITDSKVLRTGLANGTITNGQIETLFANLVGDEFKNLSMSTETIVNLYFYLLTYCNNLGMNIVDFKNSGPLFDQIVDIVYGLEYLNEDLFEITETIINKKGKNKKITNIKILDSELESKISRLCQELNLKHGLMLDLGAMYKTLVSLNPSNLTNKSFLISKFKDLVLNFSCIRFNIINNSKNITDVVCKLGFLLNDISFINSDGSINMDKVNLMINSRDNFETRSIYKYNEYLISQSIFAKLTAGENLFAVASYASTARNSVRVVNQMIMSDDIDPGLKQGTDIWNTNYKTSFLNNLFSKSEALQTQFVEFMLNKGVVIQGDLNEGTNLFTALDKHISQNISGYLGFIEEFYHTLVDDNGILLDTNVVSNLEVENAWYAVLSGSVKANPGVDGSLGLQNFQNEYVVSKAKLIIQGCDSKTIEEIIKLARSNKLDINGEAPVKIYEYMVMNNFSIDLPEVKQYAIELRANS